MNSKMLIQEKHWILKITQCKIIYIFDKQQNLTSSPRDLE